ncbi:MAG: hypothetical protein ACK4IW_09120, partial [Brevundimonas aurantiaca]
MKLSIDGMESFPLVSAARQSGCAFARQTQRLTGPLRARRKPAAASVPIDPLDRTVHVSTPPTWTLRKVLKTAAWLSLPR